MRPSAPRVRLRFGKAHESGHADLETILSCWLSGAGGPPEGNGDNKAEELRKRPRLNQAFPREKESCPIRKQTARRTHPGKISALSCRYP